MGTWGTNIFEDDTALQFFEGLSNENLSITELASHLDKVNHTQYDMEDFDLLMAGFREPSFALVVAEIIASSLGNPSDKYPSFPKLDLEQIKIEISPEVKLKALTAIKKIKETKGIHLTELWMESESFQEWKNYLDHLSQRIN